MIRILDRPRPRRAIESPTQVADVPRAGMALARDVGPGALAVERQPTTRTLYERLDAEDVAEVERVMAESVATEEARPGWDDPAARPYLVLSYGMWFGVASVTEKTGLPVAQPPEDIHAMARGPAAAAGGLYEADLVVDALASAGGDIEDVGQALDFGCSSGRVVRVLAAAYPGVRFTACDPNEPAIAWANENLSRIRFYVNAQEPPLPGEEASLDLVYAISIWSHFAPGLGLRWFEEMRRVIRPGGHLVFTTHGLQSVAFFARGGLKAPEQADEIARALYSRGWWYAPEFGEKGDWGVVNPEWGMAFLSPEWILNNLCPLWRVLEFAPGRNHQNQDVYVLQRV